MGSEVGNVMKYATGGVFIDQIMGAGQPDMPAMPTMPAEVEEVDVMGQKQYTKQRLAQKKGRASTILAGKKLGANTAGKKTALG